jgi:hypothetical protein
MLPLSDADLILIPRLKLLHHDVHTPEVLTKLLDLGLAGFIDGIS